LVVEKFQSTGKWSKDAGSPETVGASQKNEIALKFLKTCVSGASLEGRSE
jgi:hypothetical protein